MLGWLALRVAHMVTLNCYVLDVWWDPHVIEICTTIKIMGNMGNHKISWFYSGFYSGLSWLIMATPIGTKLIVCRL